MSVAVRHGAVGLFAVIVELGGIVVIIVGMFFLKNRSTDGKILVMVGMGQTLCMLSAA